MDVPISLLHWEVFLPERYQVKNRRRCDIGALCRGVPRECWPSDARSRRGVGGDALVASRGRLDAKFPGKWEAWW